VEISLWKLAAQIDRTVLLGDPGGGKTTAANVLLHHYASNPKLPVPFLVGLREFAAHDPPERSVADYVEHKLRTFYQCPPPTALVIRLLLTGRALIIFDGLDELLDASRRSELAAVVEQFCIEYPLARVLVTSRPIGYDHARLEDRQFVLYRLGGLGDDQVAEYVQKWFAQEEGITVGEARQWADAFTDETASVPDLRSNPLMLSLMCILYRGKDHSQGTVRGCTSGVRRCCSASGTPAAGSILTCEPGTSSSHRCGTWHGGYSLWRRPARPSPSES
jgi:predicted NACHT family NTPase